MSLNRSHWLSVTFVSIGLAACGDATVSSPDSGSGSDVPASDTPADTSGAQDGGLDAAVDSVATDASDAARPDAPTTADAADATSTSDVADATAPSDAADAAPLDGTAPSTYYAALVARQEVPPAYASSRSGTATFTLNPERTTVTYTITHTVLAPTAAHIHLGLAGEAGPVIVPLMSSPGVVAGTATITPDQATAIEEGRTYVNVHSAAFPDGEIRGQIVKPGEAVFVATLTPRQENPPTASTGSGLGEFLVDSMMGRLRYVIRTQGMASPPTAAHIHAAPAGVNGPVTINLVDTGATPSSMLMGTRMITSTTELDAGRWYANVHSTMYPDGELRGQILRPGEELYLGRMTGAEEVPPVTTGAAGTVAVIVGAGRDRVTYDGLVTGVTPTAAHLHEAPMGVAGPVVLPLTFVGTASHGFEMLPAGSTLLTALGAGNIYANVHSAAHPDGEIRGQMRRVAP